MDKEELSARDALRRNLDGGKHDRIVAEARAAAIEEAAQVAEEFGLPIVAARILALKEKNL